MKTKILLMGLCTAILFACKDDKKSEIETPVNTEVAKVARAEDSIKKAEAAELELFKQDSIASLEIKGYSVKKVSGKIKYPGDTKNEVKYMSLAEALEEQRGYAKKEMWTNEKLAETIAGYKDFAKGGVISLYMERLTIGSANTDNITIIVKDKDDNEVFREELKSNVPEYSSSDYWWNNGNVFLDKRMKAPFFIYIVDKMEDEPLKFEVTSIMK